MGEIQFLFLPKKNLNKVNEEWEQKAPQNNNKKLYNQTNKVKEWKENVQLTRNKNDLETTNPPQKKNAYTRWVMRPNETLIREYTQKSMHSTHLIQ